jgi:hypothetical protein
MIADWKPAVNNWRGYALTPQAGLAGSSLPQEGM